ncbi:hypothetical protein GCM10027280_37960 [Micromonospora polyrhachis]|uniref:Peroxiredoxin n=1 Tax=Micromonospora polyrhachis TaxID=1282883 RepID=A0A7W7WSN6_9ACTN|nr:redoxin domain-containing protein [Micromonospora polyrhachis]MBB4962386.1 peroxiredoxin [Micromonospora polyrhachis]
MSYVVAALAVLATFSVFQVVLVAGLLRRVNELSGRLTQLSQDGPVSLDRMVPAGSAPAQFTTSTVDQELVTSQTLTVPTLLGFFTPGCKPCTAQLPHFVERAGATPGGRAHVLAVITDAPGTREYVARLSPVAQVVIEEPNGPVATAFGLKGTPAFALLGERSTVTASAITVAGLPSAVPA